MSDGPPLIRNNVRHNTAIASGVMTLRHDARTDETTLFEPDVTGPPTRPWMWVVGVLAALVFVGGVTLGAITVLKPLLTPFQVPTVDELAANYRTHRPEFGQLAQLGSRRNRFVIDLKRHAANAPGLDAGSLDTAKTALRTIGAQRIEGVDGDLDLELGSEGLAVSGVNWGYYYTSVPPSETVTLEVARSADAPELWYYPLGDNWYATVYRF